MNLQTAINGITNRLPEFDGNYIILYDSANYELLTLLPSYEVSANITVRVIPNPNVTEQLPKFVDDVVSAMYPINGDFRQLYVNDVEFNNEADQDHGAYVNVLAMWEYTPS